MKCRRLLRKSEKRVHEFIYNAKYLTDKMKERLEQKNQMPEQFLRSVAPGPASAVLTTICDLGAKLTLDEQNMTINITPEFGPTIDLLHPSRKAISKAIQGWTRNAVLGVLAAQVDMRNPRRKDMTGLHACIYVHTTLSLYHAKKTPIYNLPLKLFKQLLMSLIAGTTRAKDRLIHAGATTDDMCECCGVRHTTEHIIWHCRRGQAARQPYLRKLTNIQTVAQGYGPTTAAHINDLLQNNCFRHTGIAAGDLNACRWASDRSTVGFIESECTTTEEIHWCRLHAHPHQ